MFGVTEALVFVLLLLVCALLIYVVVGIAGFNVPMIPKMGKKEKMTMIPESQVLAPIKGFAESNRDVNNIDRVIRDIRSAELSNELNIVPGV